MENLLRKNNIMFHEKDRKIKAILKEELNNKCVDCKNAKPDYISLNNACFICKTCFKIHQKFPISISKTIKNNLKLLTLKELQYLYFGGNKKLIEFMKYEYPKLIKLNPAFSYKTIAMDYYRNWLKFLIEGGNKPIKPDIEIAYRSIDEKDFINNNNISNNNNENNVITIDFFNDCYNYNDKYNHTITNFINKKNSKNNLMIYKENKLKYDTQNNFYRKRSDDNNMKDFFNYYKDINRDNYNKYINTQTIDLLSHTQSNFMAKKNNNIDNIIVNSRRNHRNKSQEDMIIDSNRIQTENLFNKNEENNYYNDNRIRAFKSNNKIYIKPKHNILKSSEKNQINNNRIREYKEENENNNNNNLIKVKRNSGYEDKNEKKEEKDEARERILINYKNRRIYSSKDKDIEDNAKNFNDEQGKINIDYSKITKGKITSPVSLRNINYSLNNINNINNNLDSKRKSENNNYLKKNEQSDYKNLNTKPNINDNLQNNNNIIIFKKKNLKNSFCVNYEKKSKRNFSTVQHSQFEILSKNKKKMNTTNDESRESNNNDDSMSVSTRTLTLNKSMKHFYSRYPRKMNKTITKRGNLDNSKRKEGKEGKEKHKLKKLKKEKSEIIRSLKILMKKKDELANRKKEDDKRDDDDNTNEDSEESDENEKNENNNIKYKYKNNDNNKRKVVNIIKKNDDFKYRNNYRGREKEKEKEKKYRRKKDSSSENEEDEKKENKYKNIREKKKKILYTHQSQEVITKNPEKDEKNSIRAKYKKKSYKYSEIKA